MRTYLLYDFRDKQGVLKLMVGALSRTIYQVTYICDCWPRLY